MLGCTIFTVVGRVQTEHRPGRGRIAGVVHRDVGARGRSGAVDEENDREPGIGLFVKIATWVAGELLKSVIVEFVNIEWTRHYRAISAIDGESRVDRLYYKTIANT